MDIKKFDDPDLLRRWPTNTMRIVLDGIERFKPVQPLKLSTQQQRRFRRVDIPARVHSEDSELCSRTYDKSNRHQENASDQKGPLHRTVHNGPSGNADQESLHQPSSSSFEISTNNDGARLSKAG